MSKQKTILTALLIFVALVTLPAQEPVTEFYTRSLHINDGGMLVLGSWAIANIVSGAVGWSRNDGQRKYFHQMNLFWNTVNLTIAGLSIYGSLQTDLSLLSADEMLSRQLKSQRLYLINAGLDVAYLGTGFALRALSDRSAKYQERFTGYGNSVILQGAFLFVFDLAMFGIQRSHSMAWANRLSPGVMGDTWGLTATLAF